MPVVIAMLPTLLPQLRNILKQFPETPVALDHFAFPNLEGGPPYANAPEHSAPRRLSQPEPEGIVEPLGTGRGS